ncbi:UNVERIFIED_CONTAM: hypothetical protein FKN15_029667 [Acipenser sinensis]
MVTTTSVASTSKVTRVAAITQTPGKGTVLAVPRVSTPQQNGTPQAPQTTTIQLPANFKIPQGMVLIRSDKGQLMLVSQQALAQAQAQGARLPRPAVTTPTLQAPTPQAAVTTLRKQESATIVKNQSQQISPAVTSVQRMPVVKTTGIAVSATSVQTVRPPATTPAPAPAPAPAPTTIEGSKAESIAQSPVSAQTVENAKKCKNFLVTLIKLASSGTNSAEMAKNVKELVLNLLDAKIEPEEFTDRLYTELKSSPQPYLVPFLKRSLPAVRQLTPNSQLFIQQCVLQKDGIVSTAAITAQQAVKQTSVTVIANSKTREPAELAQSVKPAHPVKPAQLIVQQTRGDVVKPPASIAQSQQSTQIVNRIQLKTPVTTTFQSSPCPAGIVVKQASLLGPKVIRVHAPLIQKNNLKENGAALFRDEDDINDVASMAGVNLNEENARILATNSELVGSVIRSCRDEPFLLTSVLQKKILETGKRYGITEVNPDVVSLVSHATQERLWTLVEKMTVAAQHRTRSYKDDSRNVLLNDTRSQLKFFEQLDRLEKQRKDEQEREMLLRVAKSRSNKEDPDQLRLKQKAKETICNRDVTGASQSAIPKQFSRLRTTRASLKDLIFCMEQEQAMRQSITLYRAFLK